MRGNRLTPDSDFFGEPKRIMPSVAAKESWKEIVESHEGEKIAIKSADRRSA